MKDESRSQVGWTNYTRCCSRPYWIRNVDSTAHHARRYVSPDSNELFSCECKR